MAKKTINLVLCGIGTVGGTLLEQIAEQHDFVLQQRGIDIKVVGVVDIFNIITPLNPPEGGTLDPTDILSTMRELKEVLTVSAVSSASVRSQA